MHDSGNAGFADFSSGVTATSHMLGEDTTSDLMGGTNHAANSLLYDDSALSALDQVLSSSSSDPSNFLK